MIIFTRNVIASVEERYWNFVRNRLAVLEIDYLEGPIYENANGRCRDYMFFSNDCGTVNRNIMTVIGGEYEHTVDGERVA